MGGAVPRLCCTHVRKPTSRHAERIRHNCIILKTGHTPCVLRDVSHKSAIATALCKLTVSVITDKSKSWLVSDCFIRCSCGLMCTWHMKRPNGAVMSAESVYKHRFVALTMQCLHYSDYYTLLVVSLHAVLTIKSLGTLWFTAGRTQSASRWSSKSSLHLLFL